MTKTKQIYVPITPHFTATIRLDVLNTWPKLRAELVRLILQERPGYAFVMEVDAVQCLENAGDDGLRVIKRYLGHLLRYYVAPDQAATLARMAALDDTEIEGSLPPKPAVELDYAGRA